MKNFIISLALAMFASSHMFAEEINLRISYGNEESAYTGKTDYTGKTLRISVKESRKGIPRFEMFVDNSCIWIGSSSNPSIRMYESEVRNILEKKFNNIGSILDCYSFYDYSILDDRPSKCFIVFLKKNSGDYELRILKDTYQGKDVIFSTLLVAKIDNYAAISGLFKKYFEKIVVEPYNITKSKDNGYEMTSYYQGIHSYSKIIGFDNILDIYSFFLEVKDHHGTEDVSNLAKRLKGMNTEGSASGTIILILDNDEKPIKLDHNFMEAVDNSTVRFNLTMGKWDFFNLVTSNIIAIKTSGDYTIYLGPNFNSGVTLRRMALLARFD